MSETITNTDTAIFDPTDLSEVGDNSRVEDPAAYSEAVSELGEAAKAAGESQVNDAGAKARMARARAKVRGTIMRPNGFPDWGAVSDVYKTIVERVETNALSSVTGLDDKNRKKLTDAVRQQVSRVWLLQAVALWIVTHENGFAREAEKAETDLAALVANPSVKLRKRIREHYASTKNLSDPYKEAAGSSGAGSVGATDTVVSALKRSATAVSDGKVTPVLSTESILAMLYGIGRQITGAKVSDVESRPVVIDNLQAISRVSLLIAKAADGKATDSELAKLSELIEVPADDDAAADDADDEAADDAAADQAATAGATA